MVIVAITIFGVNAILASLLGSWQAWVILMVGACVEAFICVPLGMSTICPYCGWPGRSRWLFSHCPHCQRDRNAVEVEDERPEPPTADRMASKLW